jgi:hypothetical protein
MRPSFVGLANLVNKANVVVVRIGSCSRQVGDWKSADASRLAGTDPYFDSQLS